MYSRVVLEYATLRGIAYPELNLPLIVDGCSGRLSWLYMLSGRVISCHDCCVMHDIDYYLGGSSTDRKIADYNLRACACNAGCSYPGVHGFLVRRWRIFRAWFMWGMVRIFGRMYWGK